MVDVNSRRRLCTLVAAAFVDGKFESAEKAVIFKKGRELGFTPQQIDEIVELGKKGALAVSIPPTQKQKEDLLDDLIDVACADGRLEPAENHLLMKFAGQIGLQVQGLGDRVRKRMKQSRRPSAPPPDEAIVVIDDKPVRPAVPNLAQVADMTHHAFQDQPADVGQLQLQQKTFQPPATAGPLDTTREALRPQPPPGTVGGPDPLANLAAAAGQSFQARPAGPIHLDDPMLAVDPSGGTLGWVQLELVKQRLMMDGREGALHYLKDFCGVEDSARASSIVEDILRREPNIKPGRGLT